MTTAPGAGGASREVPANPGRPARGTEAAPETSDRGPPTWGGIAGARVLGSPPPPLPGDPAGAGNQAHMARPALFVLAARRRCWRRFLSPRNQQNPKRSLGKMKGAEGLGRGGPRGCGGLGLAPGRRGPGGERARPWGVSERAGREAGVHSRSPLGGRLPAAPAPARPPETSERGFLQSVFEAAPEGRRFRTWRRAAEWGGGSHPETARIAASDTPPPAPLLLLPPPSGAATRLPSPREGPWAGGALAVRPGPGGRGPGAPLVPQGSPRGEAAQSPIVAGGWPPQSGFCSSANSAAGTADCGRDRGG